MWTVDLVPAKGVEVNTKGFDIHCAVRRVGDGIDAEHGAGDRVDGFCDGGYVGDGAKDVGGVRAADEAGLGRQ